MTQREIKFRAWDKKNNRMVYDITLTTQDASAHPVNGNWDDIIQLDDYEHKTIIMQYTGLHDKNGKEIYEGDILKDALQTASGKLLNRVVEFRDGCFGFDGGGGLFYTSEGECSKGEVIGNIFENPDLLAGENK
jgi:uncharacterized phage protein (TIGR01671 family)